jgi:uncharacterized protein
MSMNDLTAPLGRGPKRPTIKVPVAKIAAVALGLFLGAFVLWAMIAQDRLGGEPVAVAPADLRIAKKPPQVVPVPQAAAAVDAVQPAAPAAPASTPPLKSPGEVIVTIVDGKTGAKREVVVAAPSESASASDRTRSDQSGPETTGALPKRR